MKKKILIVEDEINITELIKYNLEKEGFSILSARDGIEGAILAHRESPELNFARCYASQERWLFIAS